jgi:hypothetical protein
MHRETFKVVQEKATGGQEVFITPIYGGRINKNAFFVTVTFANLKVFRKAKTRFGGCHHTILGISFLT